MPVTEKDAHIPKWYPPETKKRKHKEQTKQTKNDIDTRLKHFELCKVWAKKCYSLGLNVIPIRYKSKKPNIATWEKWEYERIPRQTFDQWIRTNKFGNVAIIGGFVSKDLVCFDIDDPADFKLLELNPDKLIADGAWVTKTPKELGRYHIVIRDNNRLETGRHEKHIDYRATGCYWLIYPSIHPTGRQYNFLNTHDPDKLVLPTKRDTMSLFNKWNDVLNQKKGTKKTIGKIISTKLEFDNSPDCIRNAFIKGAAPGARYYVAIGLSSYLQQQKFPLEIAESIIVDWFNKKCDTTGRPVKDIVRAVRLVYEHKKYATGCKYWRDKTFFCPYKNKEECKFFNPKKENVIVVDPEQVQTTETETETKEFIETPGYINDKSFIGQYTTYQNLRTNAPLTYGTHIAINMLGHCMGRKTVNRIQPNAVHHNIYLILLGKSGKARKSTAQDIGRTVYPQETAMPDGFSPEGYLSALSEQPQGMGWLGEFSTLLRGINQGGYMANFKEILNDLFGCPLIYQKRLSKKKNSFLISEPYLSFVSTCTEEGMFPNLNPDMIHGGFLARDMMVYGETKYRKRAKLTQEVEELESEFRKAFRNLYKLFQKDTVVFELTEDGFDALDEICRELEDDSYWNGVSPFVSRYENYIVSYADILKFSDMLGEVSLTSLSSLTSLTSLTSLAYKNIVSNDNSENNANDANDATDALSLVINVDSDYIKRAWIIISSSLEYTRDFVRYIEEDFNIGKVETVINKFAPVDHATALRNSHLSGKDFKEALNTLKSRETIFSINTVTKSSGRVWYKDVYCTRANIDTEKCKKCSYKCSITQRTPPLATISKTNANKKQIKVTATPKTDDKSFYFDKGETKDKQTSLDQAHNIERVKEYVGTGLVTELGLLAFIKNILNKRKPDEYLKILVEKGILFRKGKKIGFTGGK